MLAFSFVLVLLTASISFRPMTLEQSLARLPSQFNTIYGLVPQQPGMPKPPTYAIENYRQTNDAPNPWDGEYSWEFVLTFQTPADKTSAKNSMMFPFVDIEM